VDFLCYCGGNPDINENHHLIVLHRMNSTLSWRSVQGEKSALLEDVGYAHENFEKGKSKEEKGLIVPGIPTSSAMPWWT
jgi:hypothetical protein